MVFVWIYVGMSDSLDVEGGFSGSGRKLAASQEFWFILAITVLCVHSRPALTAYLTSSYRVLLPWVTVRKVPVEITTVSTPKQR